MWNPQTEDLICRFGRWLVTWEGKQSDSSEHPGFLEDLCNQMDLTRRQYDRLRRAWRSICAVNEELWQTAREELRSQ